MTAKSTWFSFSFIRALRWSAVSCGVLFIVKSSTTVTVGLVDSLMWSSKACMRASASLRSVSVKSRLAIHFKVSLERAAVSSVRHRSLRSSSPLYEVDIVGAEVHIPPVTPLLERVPVLLQIEGRQLNGGGTSRLGSLYRESLDFIGQCLKDDCDEFWRAIRASRCAVWASS